MHLFLKIIIFVVWSVIVILYLDITLGVINIYLEPNDTGLPCVNIYLEPNDTGLHLMPGLG